MFRNVKNSREISPTSVIGGLTKKGIFPLCQSLSTIFATVLRSGLPPYKEEKSIIQQLTLTLEKDKMSHMGSTLRTSIHGLEIYLRDARPDS